MTTTNNNTPAQRKLASLGRGSMKKAAIRQPNDDFIEFGNSQMINLQRDLKIKKVDDLSFVTRDAEGRVNWWAVALPKTSRWSVHYELGKAYGLELLDLIHNPDGQATGQQIGYICWEAGQDRASTSVAQGFFEILGVYLVDGDVSR